MKNFEDALLLALRIYDGIIFLELGLWMCWGGISFLGSRTLDGRTLLIADALASPRRAGTGSCGMLKILTRGPFGLYGFGYFDWV